MTTASKSLAEQALGRVISAHIDVTLTPPQGELGRTDEASEIGRALVNGALQLLRNAAEFNGFSVEIEVNQVVY